MACTDKDISGREDGWGLDIRRESEDVDRLPGTNMNPGTHRRWDNLRSIIRYCWPRIDCTRGGIDDVRGNIKHVEGRLRERDGRSTGEKPVDRYIILLEIDDSILPTVDDPKTRTRSHHRLGWVRLNKAPSTSQVLSRPLCSHACLYACRMSLDISMCKVNGRSVVSDRT